MAGDCCLRWHATILVGSGPSSRSRRERSDRPLAETSRSLAPRALPLERARRPLCAPSRVPSLLTRSFRDLDVPSRLLRRLPRHVPRCADSDHSRTFRARARCSTSSGTRVRIVRTQRAVLSQLSTPRAQSSRLSCRETASERPGPARNETGSEPATAAKPDREPSTTGPSR